jgi:large subunit ribosomal protein L2
MKHLKRILKKVSGRNSSGKVTVRHQGGRVKRYFRLVDFKRDKTDIWGKVMTIERDPNRKASIALVYFTDGEKRYILAPLGLTIGAKVITSTDAPLEIGNALPLSRIPVGTQIHNIEIVPGKGGQIVRSAGSFAVVFGVEKDCVLVKMSSGEIRRFDGRSLATIGQIGNPEAKKTRIGKAGTMRRMGVRPTVRGVAMHPNAHPHGGGEGRSSVGLKYPKTPWGKPAVGKTRNKKRYSNRIIVSHRKGARK